MPQAEIPTEEPTRLQAGDSWEWDRCIADYLPSDGWSLAYVLRGPTTKNLSATPSGDVFEVRIAAANTESLPQGHYRLFGQVSKGTDRYTIYEGPAEVIGNPATAGQTRAERMVEKLEAELEARSAGGARRWQQGQRSAEYDDADLRKQLAYWRKQVQRERGEESLTFAEVSFVRAS